MVILIYDAPLPPPPPHTHTHTHTHIFSVGSFSFYLPYLNRDDECVGLFTPEIMIVILLTGDRDFNLLTRDAPHPLHTKCVFH